MAKRAGSADDCGAGRGQLAGTGVVDALTGFFAQENESSSGAAAKRAFAGAGRVQHFGTLGDDLARFVIYAAITSQIAGIVENYALFFSWG